uniref:7TM GPCR serpentine receptor class x (Srx) domain-containing protein n=1 Tax=Wuchereria bancrofti TaxID=6293 RepID=A0AAF5PYG9_WUCBA
MNFDYKKPKFLLLKQLLFIGQHFYWLFLFRIRHERKCAIATSKYERMMLIQAVFVCGAMEIQIICFNFLSKLAIKLAGKEIEIPVNILTNCFVIFTAAVLPTANLIFVKRFRESVKQAFVKLFSKIKIMKKMSTVTPVTLTMSKIH